MKTNVLALSSRSEFDQAVYQEDILIELSERLALEMEYAQIQPEELQKLLGKNEAYVTGLLEGFANIRLKELADIFSVFNKYVKLMPAYEGQKVCYLEDSKFNTVKLNINPEVKIAEDFRNFSIIKHNDNTQTISKLVNVTVNNNFSCNSEFQGILESQYIGNSLPNNQHQIQDIICGNNSLVSNVN